MPYKRIDTHLSYIILIIFSFILGYAIGEHKTNKHPISPNTSLSLGK